jgi:hypothetical protein
MESSFFNTLFNCTLNKKTAGLVLACTLDEKPAIPASRSVRTEVGSAMAYGLTGFIHFVHELPLVGFHDSFDHAESVMPVRRKLL